MQKTPRSSIGARGILRGTTLLISPHGETLYRWPSSPASITEPSVTAYSPFQPFRSGAIFNRKLRRRLSPCPALWRHHLPFTLPFTAFVVLLSIIYYSIPRCVKQIFWTLAFY